MEKVLIGRIANLEWGGSADREGASYAFTYKSKSVFGEYSAIFNPGETATNLLFDGAVTSFFGDLSVIKDAAQKDFESRIKKCFSQSVVCVGFIEASGEDIGESHDLQ